MIEIGFNALGMPIYSCNHTKGYFQGKGRRLCARCEKKLIKKLKKELEK